MSELFLYNFFGLTCKLLSFVSFEVLPLAVHTPLPTFFPLPEAVLEGVFRDRA